MLTLLRNYIREQKNSWLQVFGLGFLIIIMVTTFLSLNFATTFLTNQYTNDIAHNQFHQLVYFNIPTTDDSNYSLNANPYTWDDDNAFFENMNYYQWSKSGNLQIIEDKLKNATFQLVKAPDYSPENAANHQYYYRLIFNTDPSISNTENIAMGQEFAQKVGHNYIDFKLSMPFNYPSEATHYDTLDQFAAMMNTYVYDSTDSATYNNRVNFFISSQAAAYKYNNMVAKGELPYATRTSYDYHDIINESKIYQQFLIGMLYGDNVSWRKVSLLTDIIMTGKTFAFVQTTPKDVIGAPMLIKNGGTNLETNPLKDNEILIYKSFADQNNLQIGDPYVFAGHKLVIRGFATSALVANKNLYFNKTDDKNQTVAFVNETTYNEITTDPYTQLESSDFVVYNPDTASKNIGPQIDNFWLYTYLHNLYEKKLKNGSLIGYDFFKAIPNAIEASGFMQPLNFNHKKCNSVFEQASLGPLEQLKSIFKQISSVFLVLIFVITTVIIFIIIFKMIDRNKQLIGILKANGYQSWKLNFALILSIILPLFLFAIIGSVISIFISKLIIEGFTSIFALLTVTFSFNLLPTILVVTIPILVLLIISFFIVAYLLKTPPLTLINNSWSKKKYNFSIGFIFSFLTSFLIKNFNYRNKLVITNSFRSLGKLSLVIVVSFFASTLVLFSLASNGLVRNMLGLQFASINYSYASQYDFDSDIMQNFVDSNNQLLYKSEKVTDIKAQPSLYNPIRQAVQTWIANPASHPIVNFRYGYVMGSELYKLRKEVIEPAIDKKQVPQQFIDFWYKNLYFIDYLTNNNGKSNVDLMINFGLMAYNDKLENPFSSFAFNYAAKFDVNKSDPNIYYDNNTNTLVGDWDAHREEKRVVNAVNPDSEGYIKPGFNITNFNKFSNLSLSNMQYSNWWQDQNFIKVRNQIIQKLGIKDPATASVQVIPMVGAVTPTIIDVMAGGDGNYLNKTVIYRYQGLDKQTKYIIGVVYDGGKNLLSNVIMMPQKWLNGVLLGNNSQLADSFSNNKFSNLNSNELHNYLPIISKINNYNFDISQISDPNYLTSQGVTPGLKSLYDVSSIREIIKAQQYTFQVLLTFFGIFLVLLTLMIVIIISNINIRDNLILINILRSLGYSFFEISYIFLIVALPLLIIFGIFSIYVAPMLTAIVASSLTAYLGILFPVVFRWWYYAVSFITIILIYFISYLITWKLNVSHKHLIKLTK